MKWVMPFVSPPVKIAKTTDSYKKAETKLAEKKLDGKFTVQEINLKGADDTQLHQMDGYVVWI